MRVRAVSVSRPHRLPPPGADSQSDPYALLLCKLRRGRSEGRGDRRSGKWLRSEGLGAAPGPAAPARPRPADLRAGAL